MLKEKSVGRVDVLGGHRCRAQEVRVGLGDLWVQADFLHAHPEGIQRSHINTIKKHSLLKVQ